MQRVHNKRCSLSLSPFFCTVRQILSRKLFSRERERGKTFAFIFRRALVVAGAAIERFLLPFESRRGELYTRYDASSARVARKTPARKFPVAQELVTRVSPSSGTFGFLIPSPRCSLFPPPPPRSRAMLRFTHIAFGVAYQLLSDAQRPARIFLASRENLARLCAQKKREMDASPTRCITFRTRFFPFASRKDLPLERDATPRHRR